MRLLASGLAGIVVLSSCAAPGGDPCAQANRNVNLGTLIGNSVSGSYGACLTSMQGELSALRLEASSLRSQAGALNAQAAQLDGERQAAARRLAAINAEQAQLLDRIAAAGATAPEAQASSAVAEANAVNREIEVLNDSGGADSAAAAEIRARQERLNRLAQVMVR